MLITCDNHGRCRQENCKFEQGPLLAYKLILDQHERILRIQVNVLFHDFAKGNSLTFSTMLNKYYKIIKIRLCIEWLYFVWMNTSLVEQSQQDSGFNTVPWSQSNQVSGRILTMNSSIAHCWTLGKKLSVQSHIKGVNNFWASFSWTKFAISVPQTDLEIWNTPCVNGVNLFHWNIVHNEFSQLPLFKHCHIHIISYLWVFW